MITRLALQIPVTGPLYEGHFPGRPILPGIGLLHLSMNALAAAGTTQPLRAITSLKLRKPVSPGDALDLELKGSEPDGSVRFDVRRGSELVANASLILGSPLSAPAPLEPDVVSRPVVDAPALHDLIPHRPPMRFVESVDAEWDDGVTCAVRIPGHSAFTDDGSAPALVAVEMAAQSAAVFEALRRGCMEGASSPRIGYLVGARDVVFARARLDAEKTVRATIRQSGLAPPLSTYDFAVVDGRDVVASGTLSTWLTATAA